VQHRHRPAGAGFAQDDQPVGGFGAGDDLRAQADVPEDAVKRVLDDRAPSVDVVGYSAGGVVTRVWLDRRKRATSTRRVRSLDSPLPGTKPAAAGSAPAPGSCPAAAGNWCPATISSTTSTTSTTCRCRGCPSGPRTTRRSSRRTRPGSKGVVNLSLQSLCPDARVAHAQLPTDPLVTALLLLALGTDPLAVPKDRATLRGGA
jgi:triacylglycerol lipase